MASVLTLVSPASAATDIMNTEGFDANNLMLTLCNGPTGERYWDMDPRTGAVRELSRKQYGALSIANVSGVDFFKGHCYYPESTSWTWTGAEAQVSQTLVNCSSRSTLTQSIQANGTTTSTTTNSVTAQNSASNGASSRKSWRSRRAAATAAAGRTPRRPAGT